MRHTKRIPNDRSQTEFFGIVWLTSETHPHRLRAGDVIRYDGRLCRVVRVNDMRRRGRYESASPPV